MYAPTERAPNGQSWNNLNKKITEVVLGSTPNYDVNTHVSIPIKQVHKRRRTEVDMVVHSLGVGCSRSLPSRVQCGKGKGGVTWQ